MATDLICSECKQKCPHLFNGICPWCLAKSPHKEVQRFANKWIDNNYILGDAYMTIEIEGERLRVRQGGVKAESEVYCIECDCKPVVSTLWRVDDPTYIVHYFRCPGCNKKLLEHHASENV